MSQPTPAVIVARFLKANHYHSTLEAFLAETKLPQSAAVTKSGDWTIEKILEEKRQFDTSLAFERQGDGQAQAWTEPAPAEPHEPEVEIKSNVLNVRGSLESNDISVTGADRTWRAISGSPPYQSLSDAVCTNESPILSTQLVPGGFVLSTAMSGKMMLHRAEGHLLVDECRNHAKYAVQVSSYVDEETCIVASAGWDQKVIFYAFNLDRLRSFDYESVTISNSSSPVVPGLIGEPVNTQTLASNPESLVFVKNPDTNEWYLVVSRRDSTFLYYFRINIDDRQTSPPTVTVTDAGRQNLAPHSNAWVAFTPCSLASCPKDPTLLAIATSHIPHLKVIVVRLLFPDNTRIGFIREAPQNIAAVARHHLALQDREDAAISLHVTTMAPQTPYSTPQVVWRPDGSGLFVNGDDGVIRGVESQRGKVVSFLKGHEVGSKVRTLWAGKLRGKNGRDVEVLVSGGFDKKVFVWTAPGDS